MSEAIHDYPPPYVCAGVSRAPGWCRSSHSMVSAPESAKTYPANNVAIMVIRPSLAEQKYTGVSGNIVSVPLEQYIFANGSTL